METEPTIDSNNERQQEAINFEFEQKLNELDLDQSRYSQVSQSVEYYRRLVSENFKLDQQEKIQATLIYMIELHKDQEDRPDGLPYISHPLEVSRTVVEDFGIRDVELIQASLLHDAVEDQGMKMAQKELQEKYGTETGFDDFEDMHQEEIRGLALGKVSESYGKRVSSIIESLSNPDFTSKAETYFKNQGIENPKPEDIQAKKNDLYREHVEEAIKDPDVLVIKLADFYNNALRLGEIKDETKRAKLIAKYSPVIQVFIDRLNDENLPCPIVNKAEVIAKLTEAGKPQKETNQEKLANGLASILHEEWRATRKKEDGSFEPREKTTKDRSWIEVHSTDKVDIANTSFEDLPSDWQAENKDSAEVGISEVLRAVSKGAELDDHFTENASAVVHQKWLERNGSWAPQEQSKPYAELSEEEKEKDRAIVKKAIEIYRQQS